MGKEFSIHERLANISRTTNRKLKRGNIIIKAGLTVAAGLVILKSAHCIDVHMFPVVSKMQIFNATESEDGTGTVFQIGFTKYRSCKILSSRYFHMSSKTHFKPVRILWPEGKPRDPTLPKGRITSMKRKAVGLTRQELLWETIVVARHQCHPFWIHERQIY